MEIHFSEDLPKYKQIVEQFEQMILNGQLQAGDVLPTERDLARKLSVNRSTVVKAYDELRATGLVYSKQGSGTKVSDHLWELIPTKLINWKKLKRMSFSPYQPIISKMYIINKAADVMDFATRNLSKGLIPLEQVDSSLVELTNRSWFFESDVEVEYDTCFEIAKYVNHYHGIQVNSKHIITTPGVPQAIALLIYSFLETGQSVAIECPSFTYRVSYFISSGIKMVRLPVDEEGLIPEAIPDLYKKHRIKMVFTNPTYQNPTGSTLSLLRRRKLIEICKELKIPIVELDLTSLLNFNKDRKPPASLYELDEKNEVVIHVGGMNDVISQNMYLGWIFASPPVLRILGDAVFQAGLVPSTITRQFATSFLKNPNLDSIIEHVRCTYRDRKEKFISTLDKLSISEVIPVLSEGGTHLWCKHNLPMKDLDFIEICLKNGVTFIPGSLYGADHGYMRFSLTWCNEEMIEEGLKRLKKALIQSRSLLQTSLYR
ncbi:PLP-dependent aminotransferase family protein [Bacillus salitolerans]|uniref:PLP-dependent aminotransferase family protein n=1 Tax=Bacillus salitolerans TaxID=1437434 RepID=A0ABW4LK21_9BACI